MLFVNAMQFHGFQGRVLAHIRRIWRNQWHPEATQIENIELLSNKASFEAHTELLGEKLMRRGNTNAKNLVLKQTINLKSSNKVMQSKLVRYNAIYHTLIIKTHVYYIWIEIYKIDWGLWIHMSTK